MWEGGTMDTERRRRPVGPVGGAVRDHRGERGNNVGLNRPPCCALSLTHACL